MKQQLDERIQSYLAALYSPFAPLIKASLFATGDEVYGELYYYSIKKLLQALRLKPEDHFLDIGSGLGRLALQVFLCSKAASTTGIEINDQRHELVLKIERKLKAQLPNLFTAKKTLNFIYGDFLVHDFSYITVVYVCSTVFSLALLQAIAEKIDTMAHVHTIVSLRKLPLLNHFILRDKFFLHGTWDQSACFVYTRKF